MSSHAWTELETFTHRGEGPLRLRVLVVTAHPDDETIGAGALLSRSPDSHVLCLTDGAPKDARFWPGSAPANRSDYASLRREELRRALSLARLTDERVRFGGAPDQEAIDCLETLYHEVLDAIDRITPDLVLTHAYEGGHPDHDAAALLVRRAARRTAVGEMPFYHRGSTGELLPCGSPRDGRVTMWLSSAERKLKERMLACFETQREVLRAFRPVTREVFRPAPEYDFREPPHEGPLHYEQLGFSIDGTRWRERAMAIERCSPS